MAIPLSEIIEQEKKIKQFEKKGITTVEELLEYFPRKYIDRRYPVTPLDLEDKDQGVMLLKIQDVIKRTTSSNSVMVIAKCYERKSGIGVDVVWFNMAFMYNQVVNLCQMDVVVGGKLTHDNYGYKFTNPALFTPDIGKHLRITPIYSVIKGMSNVYLENIMEKAINTVQKPEYLTPELIEHFHLIHHKDLYRMIHYPQNEEELQKAEARVIFDRMYTYALEMEKQNSGVQCYSSFMPAKLENCQSLINSLPYRLTTDQQNVIKGIIDTARKGMRVNALIQGDVSCGKTITAFLLMLAMSDNGYQSVLMAPTGVLARQHYEEFVKYITPFGLKCAYLEGGMKASERKAAIKSIKNGEVQFIIGTHACISDEVEYNNLGLAVVDEEHKFGKAQREKLKEKANTGVHYISMSATPIPRSLALALYGGKVDIYTIHTMPNGRVPTKTAITNDDLQIYNFMLKEIKQGHQCYMVCPQITAEYSVDSSDGPESVEEVYKKTNEFFNQYGINVAYLTGKAKESEKEQVLSDFNNGKYQILIATTIIEVGVNNPNATVMSIMSADRFGLAGLHQLRGRVGRSNLQSYCILKSNDMYNPRLQAMTTTTDGFKIAEIDLSLRGTGDFIGTEQTGVNENVMMLMKYPALFEDIKQHLQVVQELTF